MERKADSGGPDVDRSLDGRNEGRNTKVAGVQAEEQVMHGGIAHHDHIEDVTQGGVATLSRPARPNC